MSQSVQTVKVDGAIKRLGWRSDASTGGFADRDNSPQSILLTYAEASTFLNLSERTLSAMVKREAIPFVRFGRAVRFNVESLRVWLRGRENQRGVTDGKYQ